MRVFNTIILERSICPILSNGFNLYIFLVSSLFYAFYEYFVFCAVSQLISIKCSNKLLDFRQL